MIKIFDSVTKNRSFRAFLRLSDLNIDREAPQNCKETTHLLRRSLEEENGHILAGQKTTSKVK